MVLYRMSAFSSKRLDRLSGQSIQMVSGLCDVSQRARICRGPDRYKTDAEIKLFHETETALNLLTYCPQTGG